MLLSTVAVLVALLLQSMDKDWRLVNVTEDEDPEVVHWSNFFKLLVLLLPSAFDMLLSDAERYTLTFERRDVEESERVVEAECGR